VAPVKDQSLSGLPPTEVTVSGDTLLITLSGADRPGVSRTLFGALSGHDVLVVDVEQVVIRAQLILATLIAASPDASDEVLDVASATAHQVARELGMEISVVRGEAVDAGNLDDRVHVTMIGAPLRPASVSVIAGQIAAEGGNIDRIERLAAYPVTALELDVSGSDLERLRASLTEVAVTSGVDIAVQRSGIHRKAKRLIVLDVDSTLIQGEVIEDLAAFAGCQAQVAAITEAAMRGEIDFEQSLLQRVALLAGVDASAIDHVRERVQLAPGARTLVRTLRRLGYHCGIVSGGFTQITERLVAELGIEYSVANTLEVADGRLTGKLSGPVVDRAEKAAALRRFAVDAGVPLNQTVAIGDGANDLDMLDAAGLGIAFNAKPLVQSAADTAVNVPYLDAILFLLGISRDEIVDADNVSG